MSEEAKMYTCSWCGKEREMPRLRDVEQHRVGKHGPAAVPPGGGHARGQLEQPVISSAVAHGRADAPRVTASQIGETERRARALERDRARALKRSRRARQ